MPPWIGPDIAQDCKNPASIVEPLPVELKPGPASVMSREIRPDEQPLPLPVDSAFQRHSG